MQELTFDIFLMALVNEGFEPRLADRKIGEEVGLSLE